MRLLLRTTDRVFDEIEAYWKKECVQNGIGIVLIFVFLLGLVSIALNRLDLIPAPLNTLVPRNYYYAINLAFVLLLTIEVVGLIFSLSRSISDSVGKQLEILSLILLRFSFKELIDFDGPIDPVGHWKPLLYIISNGLGALFIFTVLGFYYRLQPLRKTNMSITERSHFVAKKKLVCLFLIVIFISMGSYGLYKHLDPSSSFDFFEVFYNVLIFTDILMIFISLRYLPTFEAIFRNSGFALTTLLIRIALTSPPPYSALLGSGAAVYALGLTLAVNTYAHSVLEYRSPREEEPHASA
jgi:hypothetical protein